MNKVLENTFFNVCADLDWNVTAYEESYWLNKFSPLGEDFSFSVSKKHPVKDAISYIESYDEELHAVAWIIQKWHEGAEVPGSLRDIVDDAEAIGVMLDTLANTLDEKARYVNIRVTDIKYVTDDEDAHDLLETFEVLVNTLGEDGVPDDDIISDEELEDVLSNYITSRTGFLHEGFSWQIVGEEE